MNVYADRIEGNLCKWYQIFAEAKGWVQKGTQRKRPPEGSINTFYYIELDIHKKTIVYYLKDLIGRLIHQEKKCADRKSVMYRKG